MNAMQPAFDTDETLSLDVMLHGIRDDLAAARVAAMQVLVFQMQTDSSGKDVVEPDEFMQAASEISRAHKSLHDLEAVHLKHHDIKLPEELSSKIVKVSADLGELVRILDRCSKCPEDGIRGFKAGQNLYDLCCTRVAKGLNDISRGIAAFFLNLSEKEKADDLEKTNSIAKEIGKIGRVINMVATNASIEAARVGDAGKGFTVIADEVKTLSTRVSSLSVSLTDRLA
ncbi:MAG: methyl-accepting chemotaxis protein [Roseobacter sp.]